MSDEYQYDDDDDSKSDGGGLWKFLVAVFCVLFSPSIVLGLILYSLMRYVRLRPRVIVAVCVVIDAVTALLFPDWRLFTTSQWWKPAIAVWVVVGTIVGIVIITIESREMKTSAYRTELKGDWMYHFTFRRTPLELLIKKKLVKGLQTGQYVSDERSPLGINEEGKYSVVSRYQNEANKHTLITGNSGSGKTVTLMSLIHRDIECGVPVCAIDMKGSPEFAAKMATWAHENGRTFYHFSNSKNYDIPNSPGQAYYDALSEGNSSAKADMILGMRQYDAAADVYKTVMNQLLQVVFAMLECADRDHPSLRKPGYRTLTTVSGQPKNEPINDIVTFARRTEVATFIQQWADNHRDWIKKRAQHIYIGRLKEEERKAGRILSADEKNALVKQCIETARTDPGPLLCAAGMCEAHPVDLINWNAGGIYQLYRSLEPHVMEALAKACENTPRVAQAARELLDEISKKRNAIAPQISHLAGQLRTIAASEYGLWMKPSEDGRNISLSEVTLEPGAVVLFSLNSDAEPQTAKNIGAIIMNDFSRLSAQRREAGLKNDLNIYIDEFQTLPPDTVKGLLEKARESHMAITLALQSLNQIVAAGSDAYLRSMLDTCSNFIVHAGATEKSAEIMSDIIGKTKKEIYSSTRKKKSFFLTINFSENRNQFVQTRIEDRYIIEPEKFMKLSSPDANNDYRTTAMYLTKTCSDPHYAQNAVNVARCVTMIPHANVLKDYYKPTKHENKPHVVNQPQEEESNIELPDFDLFDDDNAIQSGSSNFFS